MIKVENSLFAVLTGEIMKQINIHLNSQLFRLSNNILFIIILMIVLLCGCDKKEPLKIVFVGDLTGNMSELLPNSRNDVLLAVEERNAKLPLINMEMLNVKHPLFRLIMEK